MKKLLLLAAFAVLCSGCAGKQAQPVQANLAGFPPAYKQGYADGCASARALLGSTKDAKRFKSDRQYAQGWRDGADVCGKRGDRLN